jgi:protein SCO1/2
MAAATLVACACAAAAADAPPAADPHIQMAPEGEPLGDFTLTDQDGKPFAFSSLRGKDTLVFFGFTHCPSICPAEMLKLKLLTESLRREGAEVPAVVFVSVDGDRDTPGRMKAFLGQFSGEFVGLTGDPKAVRRIAVNFKAVFFKGLPSDDTDNYLVEHTSQIYLVDAKGRLRATFFDAPVEAMTRATQDLAKDEKT